MFFNAKTFLITAGKILINFVFVIHNSLLLVLFVKQEIAEYHRLWYDLTRKLNVGLLSAKSEPRAALF